MTPEETAALVTAVVLCLGALQAWLAARTIAHGKQLNGLMTPRIAAGAAAVVAADHIARADMPTPSAEAIAQARIIALRAELAALEAAPLASVAH